MGFNFKARVLLELGAELISSDPVAIYELVKNGLDAEANAVRIDVRVVLLHSAYQQLMEAGETQLNLIAREKPPDFTVAELNEQVLGSLESTAPAKLRESFIDRFSQPNSYDEYLSNLSEAYQATNIVTIQDNGGGMSLRTLSSSYLTVGTPERLAPKREAISAALGETSRLQYTKTDTKLPLGEKGIGRLSAMRLGHCITVQTKAAGDTAWHFLEMDWRPAFLDPTLDASDAVLDFKPSSIPCQSGEVGVSGTSITITDLQSDWSKPKLAEIASLHLAKLADPFAKHRANKFLEVTFQNEVIPVPTLDKEPLNYVDAIVEANLRYDENDAPVLKVHTNYVTHKKERVLELRGDALRACVREGLEKRSSKSKPLVDGEIVARALNHLGPWELKFYWFNRGRIHRNQRELYDNQIKGFLEQWAGGLLIYRDGYRVYPYGGRSDDWLDLDKKALASSAYKLNRAQIVGYLRLSSIANPSLLDQTNREGFRDSPDREALKRVLRWVIAGSVRQFLEQVDREVEPPLADVKQKVDQQITSSKGVAVEALRSIKKAAPTEAANVATVMRAFDQVTDAWERAKLRIENFDKEIEGYIHLAGVGLMLEFIAHELSRVTQDTLKAVTSGKMSPLAVEAQLKTLEKRVRILDELSIPGRQLRFQQPILDIAQLLGEFHQAKAARSGITLRVTPATEKSPWEEKVEKGQILQILDNLISNSFYWLDNRFDKTVPGVIEIQIVKSARQVRVTDNGPGVPSDRREFIFEQFATTKPPREGRGLGLYIARRLAEENGATLELAPPEDDGMARTFILEFGNKLP